MGSEKTRDRFFPDSFSAPDICSNETAIRQSDAAEPKAIGRPADGLTRIAAVRRLLSPDLRDIPVRFQPLTSWTAKDVHPGDVVQLILPQSGNTILHDFLEKATPVTVWGAAGELFSTPLADEYHRPPATELPPLTLDAVVCRSTQ